MSFINPQRKSSKGSDIKMDLFRKGKFQGCLDYVKKNLAQSSMSVSTDLALQNDAMVCQYMLGQMDTKTASRDFKELLIKSASLPPNVEVNRIELTLLYNYIYSDLLKTRNLEMTRAVTSSYTQATRVLYRVYSILQPLCCSDLRTDLPSDARTCCFLLVHRCIDSLPFTTDLPLLLPLCHVICLLGVLEMKRNNWVQVIALLTSLLTTVENSLIELKDLFGSCDTGLLIPFFLEDSADILGTSPTDWLHFLLAITYFAEKQWNQSRDNLQKIKHEWFVPYVTVLSGLCLVKEERFSEAITVVGDAVKTCKTLPVRLKARLFNMLGDCFGKLDKPQLSIQMYKDALSTDFGYLLPLYNISLQYQKLGTIAVELECLSLLVTSLESDLSCASVLEHADGPERFISVLDLIVTGDSNICYPRAVYWLASRCLQEQRYDIASQKYQDLIAYLTDTNSTKVQLDQSADLPSLQQIHHEAILSLLNASKYTECIALCDKVIASYQGKKYCDLSKDHDLSDKVSTSNSQVLNGVNSQNLNDNDSIFDIKNNNRKAPEIDNRCIVDNDNEQSKKTLKRKRQRSDSETSTSVTKIAGNELKDQIVSCDSFGDSSIGCESGELECLDCDVVALKYKAEALVKMGEITNALECLENAVKSISLYRKDNLQSHREIMGDSLSNDDQPVAKRQKIGSHNDRDQRTEPEEVTTIDTITQFEAGLYQVFGIILSSQRQFSDALHYYRLAAQLQPESTKIHFQCVETLFSMNCPKVAANNWLRHRNLSHISSVQQLNNELRKKQQLSRSDSCQGDSDEKLYIDMDIRCLQQHSLTSINMQQYLK